MTQPKILIIVSTFNRGHFIIETLESIKNQSFKNFECFIIDDSSIDNTSEKVKSFSISDKRFKYFLKPANYLKGPSETRNYGLDLAKNYGADYIQFFDDDDIMYPRKLELQVAPFTENPNLNFTLCKYEKKFENSGEICITKPHHSLKFNHLGDAILCGRLGMNTPGPLWRANFIDQFRFDGSLRYAEEWELYTRIGYLHPDNYAVVDEYLFQYRKHANSQTLGKDDNFEKRKTSAIIRIKLFDFLTINKLHTKESILFMAKTFLIYSYSPHFVKRLLEYIKSNKQFSLRMTLFLKVGMAITAFNRKIIAKLASGV